jgi:8-oxo-dGTP pyrophosphatase MutT (NUDIX family)
MPVVYEDQPTRLSVTYRDSYLWRLRQAIGHDLVLMPGTMVVLQRDDGRILFTRRADDGTWCLPAGAAEPGGSFARTAIDELAEETGIEVEPANLVPFGCLSEAEVHTIRYPNHCFALLFLARRWRGEPNPNCNEATEAGFFGLAALPTPIHPPTDCALNLLASYRQSGNFQVG